MELALLELPKASLLEPETKPGFYDNLGIITKMLIE